LAAAALTGTLVPTTLAAHPYWRLIDPAARCIYFFKNVVQFGGATGHGGAARPLAADIDP
jgi:putative oxidoreductase